MLNDTEGGSKGIWQSKHIKLINKDYFVDKLGNVYRKIAKRKKKLSIIRLKFDHKNITRKISYKDENKYYRVDQFIFDINYLAELKKDN